jgi:hypothetical protein
VEVFDHASTRVLLWLVELASSYSLGTDRIKNTAYNSSFIVAYVTVVAVTRWIPTVP